MTDTAESMLPLALFGMEAIHGYLCPWVGMQFPIRTFSSIFMQVLVFHHLLWLPKVKWCIVNVSHPLSNYVPSFSWLFLPLFLQLFITQAPSLWSKHIIYDFARSVTISYNTFLQLTLLTSALSGVRYTGSIFVSWIVHSLQKNMVYYI